MPEIQRALPKYLQIANHVRDQILRGDLQALRMAPGMLRRLASRSALSRQAKQAARVSY